MHKNFFHDILTYNPELLQGILAFNLQQLMSEPANALEEDMANDFSKNSLAQLWAIPEVKKKYAKKNQVFFWDFENEARRLVLLDKEVLQKLVLYMGASLNAKHIARCVTQKDTLHLQENLGHDVFNFALHRGQFMIAEGSINLFKFLKHEELLARVILSGIFALHFCSYAFPSLLYDRLWQIMEELALKIELQGHTLRTYVDGVPINTIPEKELQFLWFSMKKILIKEVAPQWKPYFSV